MPNESKITLDNDALISLLRSNLACHMGKNLTRDVREEIIVQIIEQIDYFLNESNQAVE